MKNETSQPQLQRQQEPRTDADRAHASLDAFFAEATRAEPDRLATPSQLLWRAEVLARLEADERRARRAALPTLIALVLAAAVAIVASTLMLADEALLVSSSDGWLAAWMTSPLHMMITGGTVLMALLLAIGRAASWSR